MASAGRACVRRANAGADRLLDLGGLISANCGGGMVSGVIGTPAVALDVVNPLEHIRLSNFVTQVGLPLFPPMDVCGAVSAVYKATYFAGPLQAGMAEE